MIISAKFGRARLFLALVAGVVLTLLLPLAGRAHAQTPEEIQRAVAAVYGDSAIQSTLEDGDATAPALPADDPLRMPRSRQTGAVTGIGTFLLWVLAIAIGLAVIALLFNELPFLARNLRKRKIKSAAGTPGSADDKLTEIPLPELDEVDRMAREGRYGEAVHLLLLRSINTLKDKLETAIVPALTSREVQAASGLQAQPDAALQALVQTVERSHFGGQLVTEKEYLRCKESHSAIRNISRKTGRKMDIAP